MSNQAIEHEEVLNIRWAHDDPNPVAKQARKRYACVTLAYACVR